MGSKITYKVNKNAVGHYVVHADSDFVAAFKHSADAYDFIDLARQRDAKAHDNVSYGTIEELEARFLVDFRNPD